MPSIAEATGLLAGAMRSRDWREVETPAFPLAPITASSVQRLANIKKQSIDQSYFERSVQP